MRPHPLLVAVRQELGSKDLDLGWRARLGGAHDVGSGDRTIEDRFICRIQSACMCVCGVCGGGAGHGVTVRAWECVGSSCRAARTIVLLGEGVAVCGHFRENGARHVVIPVLLPRSGASVPCVARLLAWLSVARAFLLPVSWLVSGGPVLGETPGAELAAPCDHYAAAAAAA